MTKEQIEAVFDRVRTWPVERQQDAAEMLLRMEEQSALADDLSDEELADLEEALAEAERENPVPDNEIEALFDRYRRP
jgi:hypothetical protein